MNSQDYSPFLAQFRSSPLQERGKKSPFIKKQYRHQLQVIASIAKSSLNPEEQRRRVKQYILKNFITAEEQYVALGIFYKVLGIIEPRTYRLLTETEKSSILSELERGNSLLSIAKELGRPVSTIYYFKEREVLK